MNQLVSESVVQMQFVERMRKNGKRVDEFVRCSAGIADAVSGDTIFEFKSALTRQQIFEAVGQLMLYRSAINPQAKLAIVAPVFSPTASEMFDAVRACGIQIIQAVIRKELSVA